MKKALALLCTLSLTLAVTAPAWAAEELTTEDYAYMDITQASPELRDLILAARCEIVYAADAGWSIDGTASVTHADGTVETLPKFSDLYPGWNLTEITSYLDRIAADPSLRILSGVDASTLLSGSVYTVRNGAARLNLNNHAGTNGTKITSFTAEHETAIFTITNAANTQTYNVTCLDSEGNSVSNQYYTGVPLNNSVAVDHLVIGETYTFRISSNDCPASSCTAVYTLQY